MFLNQDYQSGKDHPTLGEIIVTRGATVNQATKKLMGKQLERGRYLINGGDFV